MTLKELLRVVEEIKKDLAYTQRLEQRWVSEEKRFPLIYKYIIKQREAFESQIENTMTAQLDVSNLDDYVKNRLGMKVEKLKTEQVSPPKEEPAEKPTPKPPRIEKPAPAAKVPEPPRIEKPKPAPKPSPAAEDKAKTARKALEEAAAAAALKLRDDTGEAATQPVTAAPPKKSKETPEKTPTQTETAEAEKPSSREKLRRLASEVLDEVKKSKTD